MDESTAREYLAQGEYEIAAKRPDWDRRQAYFDGDQDLPFAPDGVNAEYQALRQQSIANWLQLALGAPLQRLRADGFRTGRRGDADEQAWTDMWQANNLDARQYPVYQDMLVHSRGLMSVWSDPAVPRSPRIRPESGRSVHLEPDPEDPWVQKWSVKRFDVALRRPTALILPQGVRSERRQVGVVHDRVSWARFERDESRSGFTSGDWELTASGRHDLGSVPFVPFDNRPTSSAVPRSDIVPLMPHQDALNTIRFQTLLAMQFAAYRQRIVVGFDPVARDDAGEIIYRKTDDGSFLLDAQGLKVPVVRSPGRPGVDRLLVFPGDATKVFDLPESNLSNYVEVLGEFLMQMFAVGQVPPQYLLSRMANLSGDALTAAESTLNSKVVGLQSSAGEAIEQVARLFNRARGDDFPDVGSEVIWAQAEVRSFAQVVDAIVKLVSQGFPHQDAWEMLPGATPQKLRQWEQHAESRMTRALGVAGLKAGPAALPIPAVPALDPATA